MNDHHHIYDIEVENRLHDCDSPIYNYCFDIVRYDYSPLWLLFPSRAIETTDTTITPTFIMSSSSSISNSGINSDNNIDNNNDDSNSDRPSPKQQQQQQQQHNINRI